MKKNLTKLMAAAMAAMMLAGCSSGSTSATAAAPADTKAETTAADTAAETEGEAKDSYTIGIGQFAEHGSLDNCREGFLEGLAQEGIKEGENLTVLYENSQADGGTASQIIDNFMAKKVDLICAIATPMAQSAYSAAKKENVPVIYTAVTDPIDVYKRQEVEDNHITIDFHVIVSYGVSICAVADNLIANVKYKVEEFTGMEVDKINIYVEGVRVID